MTKLIIWPRSSDNNVCLRSSWINTDQMIRPKLDVSWLKYPSNQWQRNKQCRHWRKVTNSLWPCDAIWLIVEVLFSEIFRKSYFKVTAITPMNQRLGMTCEIVHHHLVKVFWHIYEIYVGPCDIYRLFWKVQFLRFINTRIEVEFLAYIWICNTCFDGRQTGRQYARVQECNSYIANTLELLQHCTHPSIHAVWFPIPRV